MSLIILVFLNLVILTAQQTFIRSKVLQSGKILTVNENGILIYNQNLEQPKQIVEYSDIINIIDDLNYIDISQFLDDENYLIFCRIKEFIFLISDKDGEENNLLFGTTIDYKILILHNYLTAITIQAN